MTYEVIVGNIGTVYSGPDKVEAERDFYGYVAQSREGHGRAAGEPVTLMYNGEPIREYSDEPVVENPFETIEWGEAKETTIDITPDSLKTPEGRARVAEAQREWDQVTHELANAVSQFDEEHSVLTPGVARGMREDWHQIRTLIEARQSKQEAFLRAVANAPGPLGKDERRELDEMTAEEARGESK